MNKIMLIEPNVEQARVFEGWLKDSGYFVITAYSLEWAFSKIKIIPSSYCLCILDADFPRGITEGIYACLKLKKDEITKTIPLALLTYRGKLDEIISGLDAGADIFLLKPFETNYFLERIKLIIEDLESKKYMKGVIDLALIEFLLTMKDEGDLQKFLLVLCKGFNRVVWDKIVSIMGFIPLQVTLETVKKTLNKNYPFIRHISLNGEGIIISNIPQEIKNESKEIVVEGFMYFLYHFLDIITTLTGNIVADMNVLKEWGQKKY